MISSKVTYPGLSIVGTPSITLTTVDSKPILVLPPSMITSTLSLNSSIISLALVPLGRPDILALGAAIGPDNSINLFAILFEGILIPTVFKLHVTLFGTRSLFSNIKVKGPGKKASINFFSISVIFFVSLFNISKLLICTINGLSLGRPFAINILDTASLLKALAPSP